MSTVNPNLRLLFWAKQYLGVQEIGGENKGPEVEMFQKAVDGKAQGEPWCMAFCQFLVKKVEAEFHIKSDLFRSESVWQTWQKTSASLRKTTVEPGDLICWNRAGTELGHVGLYRRTSTLGVTETIEGNTNQAGSREGDGVYPWFGNWQQRKGFLTLGVLRPFRFEE